MLAQRCFGISWSGLLGKEMKRHALLATKAAILIAASPVLADGGCAELCDAAFYATATAEGVQQLIDGGVDVNVKDEVGKTALHWVSTVSPAVVSALLATDADVNAKDQWDRTLLHFVAATGSMENIRNLAPIRFEHRILTRCFFGWPKNSPRPDRRGRGFGDEAPEQDRDAGWWRC